MKTHFLKFSLLIKSSLITGSCTIAAIDSMIPVTDIQLSVPRSPRRTMLLHHVVVVAVIVDGAVVGVGIELTMDAGAPVGRGLGG